MGAVAGSRVRTFVPRIHSAGLQKEIRMACAPILNDSTIAQAVFIDKVAGGW
jgi:hypothetical protein